jgi:glycerol-3-phosphate acyltransferase PlsX
MRIAVDAMGGDRAPAAPVEGAIRALEQSADVHVVLAGDPERIRREADRVGLGAAAARRFSICDAPEVVGMDEDPARAVRSRPKSSVRACAELLGSGDVQGVVNMGSTGAAVAAATLYAKRLEGVRRPGIAVPFPRPGGATVVVDVGANPDARPEHLHQYAVMASLFARATLGVASPRIGILSIGEEEHKGNRLVHETWELFRRDPLPGFVGNVEAREVFEDRADVVVTDGFTGNVMLKAAEGMAEYLLGALKANLDLQQPSSASLLRALMGKVDYAEVGGAQLLGVRGAYIIGHGRSAARAVTSAIRAARAYLQHDVDGKIVEQLAATSGPAAGSARGPEVA